MPQSRSAAADFFHKLAMLLLVLLSFVVLYSLFTISTPAQTGPEPKQPPPAPAAMPSSVADQLKAENDRISSALDVLKDRTSAQQTLIATLTTLTGLYVVILSIAAYFRLQQTREESKEAFNGIKDNVTKFEQDTRSQIKELQSSSRDRISGLIAEVRTDVPALHGIGRRLERLLAELETRLPVDGDWTVAGTYDTLPPDDKEQALIDEMVINSLDIFNVTDDIGSRRTVSRLYVRLGQFYFARAQSLKLILAEETENNADPTKDKKPVTVHPTDPWNSVCRGGLYLEKAVRVDPTDPIALRARGVILMHNAIWKRDADTTPGGTPPAWDKEILAHSRLYIDKSLKSDPVEPGALFARAWLLVRENPPAYEAAIKDLTKIIDRGAKLTTRLRKKFLDICYLNRANYNARIIGKGTLSADERTAAIALIAKDLEEGMKVAKSANKDAAYRGEIRREIGKGGDFEHVYNEIKPTIDSLLTT